MKKIKYLFIIPAFCLLISNYSFSASLPSGWDELQVGVDDVTEVSEVQIEKYEIKLVSVTATYSDGSSSEIYSNASGSDAVDLVSTTAGTNGSPFVDIGSVPAGTITSIQVVISSSIKVKGYQNFTTTDPTNPNQQFYTTSSAPSGSYYATYVTNQGSNSGDATIDVSQSPYSVTTQDLTVTVSNLNIAISQDTTKKLKLVFDISESLALGYNTTGGVKIIAVPGTPAITVDSGETS